MKHRYVFLFMAFIAFGLAIGNSNYQWRLYTPGEDVMRESPFAMADDGSESSESITYFSETLDDDTMLYPDAFNNGSIETADSGTTDGYPDVAHTYVETQSLDATGWGAKLNTGQMLNLTFSFSSSVGVEGFTYSHYARTSSATYDMDIEIYNFTADSFTKIDDLGSSYSWDNGTTYDPDYWTSTEIKFRIINNGAPMSLGEELWDYAEVTLWYMTLADSNHYAESFADVSDWEIHSAENEPETDGDIGSFITPDDNGYEYWKTNAPSITSVKNYVLEMRVKKNDSDATGFIFLLHGSTLDDFSGDTYYLISGNQYASADWTTKKYHISVSYALECLVLVTKQNPAYGGGGVNFQVDYIRISPSDETGFQHDGSTTGGTFDTGGCSISSNGDVLNFTADAENEYGHILFDTTATASAGKNIYYPFIEWNIAAVGDNDGDGLVYMVRLVGTSGSRYLSWEDDTGSTYYNVLADTTVGDFNQWRLYVDNGDWVTVEYVQYYSIANFTVTQYSGCTTSDFAYVESGILQFSRGTEYWLQLDHDPSVSVGTETFSVWNITTDISLESNNIGFRPYISGWQDWQYDETRGTYPVSGTMTDFAITNRETGSISAITFIEDSTAPTVIRTNVAPATPDDDETVTLSSVVTDTVEVYTVKFNAITYPTGFSDVDYSATEGEANLWTYDFSSGDLPNGYYCFKVVASDGANENALTTEQEFVDFTVRDEWQDTSSTVYYCVLINIAYDSFTVFDEAFDEASLYILIYGADIYNETPVIPLRFYNTYSEDYVSLTGFYEIVYGTEIYAYKIPMSMFQELFKGGWNLGTTFTVSWNGRALTKAQGATTGAFPDFISYYYAYDGYLYQVSPDYIEHLDLEFWYDNSEENELIYILDARYANPPTYTIPVTEEYDPSIQGALYGSNEYMPVFSIYVNVDGVYSLHAYAYLNYVTTDLVNYFWILTVKFLNIPDDFWTSGHTLNYDLTEFGLFMQHDNYDGMPAGSRRYSFGAIWNYDEYYIPNSISDTAAFIDNTEDEYNVITIACYSDISTFERAPEGLQIYFQMVHYWVPFEYWNDPDYGTNGTYCDWAYYYLETSTKSDGLAYWTLNSSFAEALSNAGPYVYSPYIALYWSLDNSTWTLSQYFLCNKDPTDAGDVTPYVTDGYVDSDGVHITMTWPTAGPVLDYQPCEEFDYLGDIVDLYIWEFVWQESGWGYYHYDTGFLGQEFLLPYSPASTINYTIRVIRTLEDNIIWTNHEYWIELEPFDEEFEMKLAFFDTSDNWVPFEILDCNLTYSGETYYLTSANVLVPSGVNLTLEVYNKWGVLLSNTTFEYTQYKPIVLTLYELIIDNEADHVVRLDISYNGTYPNITIMLPRNFPRFLYLAPANYTMIFTYYTPTQTAGEIINYEELTGYYVVYQYELTNIGYLKYTGITLADIDANIDYTRVYTNNNIDVVDANVLAIPYPPAVPQNIVTPEMFWIGVGVVGVIGFLFAIGGHGVKGYQIAKKTKTFYKDAGATKEGNNEEREYYRENK